MKKLIGLKKRDRKAYQLELVRRARKNATAGGQFSKRSERDDYTLTRTTARPAIDAEGRFIFKQC